jgi:hypothetical protein
MRTITHPIAQILRRSAVLLALCCVSAVASAQTYTISPPPFLIALDDSGKIINNACVWTYTAGTTNVATTYADDVGTMNSNPIRSDSAGRFTAFLSPGSSYKFIYESVCVPPAHGSLLRTADNISAMPAATAGVDVIGTAGQSMTSGQAVYLSDGSGSKISGQWYLADNTNPYSSSSNWVGVTTVNIASAGTGTIRIAGEVTGFVGLTAGLTYYVGTAGAVTTTAPSTNVRLLGQADSSTSMVLTASPPIRYLVSPTITTSIASNLVQQCGARLTLTSGTPVTTTDVTGATSVFVDPYSATGAGAGICAFYDGSSTWTSLTFSEITVALGTLTSALPYDIFCFNNSGVMACDAPVAWTSATARVTGLVLQNGVYVKSGATTRRYMGTFFTTSTTQTEDSAANGYLWNYYNRIPRQLKRIEATATWVYGTGSWQQANASASNQVNMVIGVDEQSVSAFVTHAFSNVSASNTLGATSIGLDSTSAIATDATAGQSGASNAVASVLTAQYNGHPGLGKHSLMWLEFGAASDTFQGTNGASKDGIVATTTH